MRILDRYLIRHLILPVVFCVFILISLILMADVLDNLGDFVKNDTPFRQIILYYLNLIPFFFVQVIPWASLLGTMFLLVNLNTHNEILAMKTAGIGISKIIRPVLFVGFVIGVLTFLINDRVLPPTFRQAQNILEESIESRASGDIQSDKVLHNLTYFSSANRLYYAKTLDASKQTIDNLIIFYYDENRAINRKVFATQAKWENNAWVLYNSTDFQTESSGKMSGQPRAAAKIVFSEMKETPLELFKGASESLYLSYKELKKQIEKLEQNQLKTYPERVALNYKLSLPWHSVVLMLIIIPLLSVTRKKKVIAMNVVYSLVLVFLFYVAGAFAMAMGGAGNLPPFFSAWANILLFTAGGLFFLDKANE